MKNIALKLSGLFFILLLWGCQKDTENVSRITYFPTFDFQGAPVVLHTLGAAYTDGAVTASEDGVDLPVTVAVAGLGTGYKGTTVPVTVADKYVITYTAINSDGFPGSKERSVYVAKNGDLVNNIEGLYTSTVFRNGTSGAQYTNMKYVMITKTGANTYEISDALAGWYELGRNLGIGYRAPGMSITATDIAANNFTFGTAVVGGFGGAVKATSLTVDAATKTLVYQCEWNIYKFVATLKQVQF